MGKQKELSCASVKSSGTKEVLDKLCLTKVERKRIDNFLRISNRKLYKSKYWKQLDE